MSASAITKIRTTAKAAIERIEQDLRKAEESVGSLQLRYGMALAPLKDASGKTFKAEAAKVSKRPYGTLNRWANAGRTAIALGFEVESKTVPTVMRIEPFFRFIKDARTPEAFAAGQAEALKVWKACEGKDQAAVVKACEKAKPSPERNENGGGRGGNASDDAGNEVTVTLDPAELEAAVAAVHSVLKAQDAALKRKLGAAWFDENKGHVYGIRSGMLRLVGEHDPAAIAVALNS